MENTMKHLRFIITGIILGTFVFFSCNQEEMDLQNKGRVNIHITDSPFPINLVNSTKVKINGVEIRKKAEAGTENSEDSFILISDSELEINLLDLTNGVTEQLASADLDAGIYDMIRLHVVDATITLNDATEYDLKVPSGYTSGLKVKIFPAISVTEGQTSDVLLDFDVNKSFVAKGNLGGKIGGFIFKPVVRGVLLDAAGRIEGNVFDEQGNPFENALVKLWLPEVEDNLTENDSLVVSSFSDAEGNFKLIGLPENFYTVTAELEGFATDTISGVSVTKGNSTSVNFVLHQEE